MNYAEYLLSKVGEEGGEAGKAANKLAVFGRFSTNPENGLTNEQDLIKEIHDFFAAVEMLHENGIINFKYDPSLVVAKKEKVIYHAKIVGILAGDLDKSPSDGITFNGQRDHVGFIAQDVCEIFPEAFTKVDYGSIQQFGTDNFLLKEETK